MNRPAFIRSGVLPGADEDARLAHFLEHYWRQRALYLPDALEDFEIPFDADELAGLACETDVDARIVRRTADGFVQEQGPFDAARFDALGDRDWTLLVNGVDLDLPGFEPLLEQVRFLPDWRLDDVMVSFAAPGGSVGPHYDRYDVFLLQATGVRRWDLGDDGAFENSPLQDFGGLSLLPDFTAARSITCEVGDGLYVPSHCVHHGIALTPCLTLSIGFRAPSLVQLADDWIQRVLEGADEAPLDLDPSLPVMRGHLDERTIEMAREVLRTRILSALDDDGFAEHLGGFLTLPPRGLAVDAPEPLGEHALVDQLERGALLERAPGLRLVLRPVDNGTQVFAAGEVLRHPGPVEELSSLTKLSPLSINDLGTPSTLALATDLYNRGLLLLTDGEP